jgi:hypothetical protein
MTPKVCAQHASSVGGEASLAHPIESDLNSRKYPPTSIFLSVAQLRDVPAVAGVAGLPTLEGLRRRWLDVAMQHARHQTTDAPAALR